MANSVVNHGKIDVFVGGRNYGLHNLTVVNDTPDADQTVFTPTSDAKWFLMGIALSIAPATKTLTIKSGSTTLNTFNFSTTKADLIIPMLSQIIEAGIAKGEALVIRSTGSGGLGTFTMKVLDAKEINLHR